jgi:hypothetical protein
MIIGDGQSWPKSERLKRPTHGSRNGGKMRQGTGSLLPSMLNGYLESVYRPPDSTTTASATATASAARTVLGKHQSRIKEEYTLI